MQNSMGSAVEAVYKLIDNKVEALEFFRKKGFQGSQCPSFRFEAEKQSASVQHCQTGKLILPTGQDSIKAGDTVIVVTTHKRIG